MTDDRAAQIRRAYNEAVREEFFDNDGAVIGFRRSDGLDDDSLRVVRDEALANGVSAEDLGLEHWPRNEKLPAVCLHCGKEADVYVVSPQVKWGAGYMCAEDADKLETVRIRDSLGPVSD